MCEPPRRCRSAAEVNQVADALCARARAKESRYDDMLTEAGKQRLRANQCEGQLLATGDIAAMVPRLQDDVAELRAQASTEWVWQIAAALTGGLSVGAVWCFLSDSCSNETAAVLGGGAAAAGVGWSVRWWF